MEHPTITFTEHTCERCGHRRGIVAVPGPHMIPFHVNARCERCGSKYLIRAQLVTTEEYRRLMR